MFAQNIKGRLWALAGRMNPQAVTLKSRTIATTSSGSDTFTSYALNRAVYKEPTREQNELIGADVSVATQVWILFQPDLDQATAPAPKLLDQIVFGAETWIIKSHKRVAMNTAYECTCIKAN